MRKNRQSESVRKAGRGLVAAVMLFFFSAFLLLALRDFAWQGFALAAAVPAMIWLGTYLISSLIGGDRLLLSLTNFLCALGVLVLYDTNPAYAYHQAVAYGVGLAAMACCVWAAQRLHSWRLPILLLAPASLVLLALPLGFGQEIYGAKNWLFIGGVSFQPSEMVKISLLIILARCMASRRFWHWALFTAACLGLLMLQKDLGTALLYFSVALLLFYASTGSLWVLAAGAAGGTGAALLGYRMFAHVKRRVAIWRNPWADYDRAGYQLVQGLMAIASGGIWGVGLGLGAPKTIPVYHTDFIFAVICEQFGLIFGLCVLAMGATLMLGLQTFVIIGGVIKLIPLTGVTMPFVSYGGSSLVSSMCLVGLIQGVANRNQHDLAEDTRLAMELEEVGP